MITEAKEMERIKKHFYSLLNKKGFALIAAILAILIITAVGLLVFTTTTQDIRVSTRVTGEKKAFSAAEAGIHQAIQNFTVGGTSGGDPNNPITWPQVDATTDPDTRYYYSVGASSSGCIHPPAGFDIEKWSEDLYAANVTGTNTRYGSTVQVKVGIGLFKAGTCAKTTD